MSTADAIESGQTAARCVVCTRDIHPGEGCTKVHFRRECFALCCASCESAVSRRAAALDRALTTMKMNPLWMILGCALPLLLIPILTRFGVNNGAAIGIAMVLMVACHFFMPGHRRDEKPCDEPHPKTTDTDPPKP